MTYNIKTGGSGGRIDAVARVICAAEPDLVAVQELRDLPPLAAMTGLRAHVAGFGPGQPVGVLVARRLRVLDAGSVRRPFHHAAAWVRVATADGPLTVVSAHLFPYWGRVRRTEARWLADFVTSVPRAVLLGDLNALDPWTDHTAALAKMPPRYRARHQRLLGRGVDTRAISLLARRGLVDVFRRCGTGQPWTVPTAAGGAEFARLRLDYVLATPAVAGQFTECRVLTGGEAEVASDHYPVCARLG